MGHLPVRNATVLTYALLGVTAAVSFLLPERLTMPTAYASGPATVRIQGIVRDFRSSHPDMNVTPVGGFGHYAGNVTPLLGPDDRPALNGAPGFKVAAQWRDSASRPIPPHLFGPARPNALKGFSGVGTSGSILVSHGGQILAAPGETLFVATNEDAVANAVTVWLAGSLIDGDVLVGPGGNPAAIVNVSAQADISGSIGNLPAALDFPTIAPPDLGPSVGPLDINSDQVLSTDMHVDLFQISNLTTVTVDGHVSIVVDQGFTVANGCQLQLTPGSTIDFYVLGNPDGGGSPGAVSFMNSTQVNTVVAKPDPVSIYYYGTEDVVLGNSAQVYANIYAPDAELVVGNIAQLSGNFLGERISVVQSGVFTQMGAFSGSGLYEVCGVPIDDTAGAAGLNSTGGISSAATFDEWFSDHLGTNLSRYHQITLTDNGSGVYEYVDNAFYPIDKALLGNEGAAHNFYFTFEFKATFTYSACSGQFFEFTGTDDAWMYVDGKLALDLGGMSQGVGQHVPLDRLELVDGETYEVKFFYAQRQGSDAIFRMRTNVPLVSQYTGMITQSFD